MLKHDFVRAASYIIEPIINLNSR